MKWYDLRNKKNLKRHELIGCMATIIEAKNKNLKGLKGLVVDETKNTITITKDGFGEKKVPKKDTIFEFHIPETKEKTKIRGDEISLQPEKRMKKQKERKRRW